MKVILFSLYYWTNKWLSSTQHKAWTQMWWWCLLLSLCLEMKAAYHLKIATDGCRFSSRLILTFPDTAQQELWNTKNTIKSVIPEIWKSYLFAQSDRSLLLRQRHEPVVKFLSFWRQTLSALLSLSILQNCLCLSLFYCVFVFVPWDRHWLSFFPLRQTQFQVTRVVFLV